ncbi:MAG: hypothetical protein AAGJ38_01345 [Planctomycetota bacterium]
MDSVEGSAHCVQCGYDLLGGPDHGLCPECGRAYDRRTGKGVVSSNAVAQQRGDCVITWVKVGLVAGLGLACVGGGFYGALRTGDWSRSMVIGGGMAIALFAIAGLIWWNDALERKRL